MNERKGITSKMLMSNEFGYYTSVVIINKKDFHNQKPCKEYEKDNNSLPIF